MPAAFRSASFKDGQHQRKEKNDGTRYVRNDDNGSRAGRGGLQGEEASELHYWRKHPNLHGWMQKLYYEKGGKDEIFNCVPVALTGQDLDRLEADVKDGELPLTAGFFFGESDGSEAGGRPCLYRQGEGGSRRRAHRLL